MRVYITKEQEGMILERFGTEPEPYEWSEQDISVQIQNYLGCGEFVKSIRDSREPGMPPFNTGFEDFVGTVDYDDYSDCQCDIQHRATKNTASGN